MEGIKFFNLHQKDDGKLKFLEGFSELNFIPERVFYIHGSKDEIRGKHAHKDQTQLLICLNGEIEVLLDDGSNKIRKIMKKDEAILIKPKIWSEQIYLTENTLLLVLSDGKYLESEYLRNYNDFISFIE